MKLDDNYTVDSDNTGAILTYKEQRVKEDGTTYTFKDNWYFVSVEQALRKYIDLKIVGCEDVKECLKRIEQVKKLLCK